MIPRLPKGFYHPVKIGSGGFGNVFRARQSALNRFVAIKFIQNKNASSRLALKNEASMQAGLHIPGIPQIYDVMEFSRQVCIVMQWVNGSDLSTFLKQHLTKQNKIALATEIISVTAQLHDKGYAHRDIKPENILVSSDGVFLIDFGLTRCNISDKKEAGVKEVKGTPAYIAPELWQGRGESSDLLRTDVFSLGKVISEMFNTSEMPSCIQRALAQDPGNRYSSASEFLHFWKKSVLIESSNWRELASMYTNDILSNQLFSASKLYLQYGKNEEAYQLIIESIQLNPDNPAALQLLDSFPIVNKNSSNKKYVPAVYCIAALLLSLSLVFLFFTKHHSIKSRKQISYSDHDKKKLIIASNIPSTKDYNRDQPFKDNSYDLKSLSGRLQIVGHPTHGRLNIDGKVIPPNTDNLIFALPTINHTGFWQGADKNITWKEVIKVLPFEEKQIWIKSQ